MPFSKAQAVLKKVLPEGVFGPLYNRACNAYDILQRIADTVYYYTPTRDTDERRKRRILRSVFRYTMTSRVGLLATYDVVLRVVQAGLRGDLVECGVARGGCAAMMALLSREYGNSRRTWLFDSYEGLPEKSEHDGEQKPVRHKDKSANDLAKGFCLGTYEDVMGLLIKLGLTYDEAPMVKGWFQDTLPRRKETIGEIAVLRLDSDWYESTQCCLENLYDNIVAGGWVIIDDYSLPGCRKAVDEFLASLRQTVAMTFDANGRAYWRKM